MTQLRYSVVIPAHDAENTILKAIYSAQLQTLPPHEVVVVSDKSSDTTVQRILDAGIENLKIYEVEYGSSAKSRNFGASMCDTEVVAFLDADDFWETTKVEKQMTLLKSIGECTIIATDAFYLNQYGTVVGRNIRTESDEIANQFLKSGKCMPSLLSTWLMPAHVFRKLNGFDSTLPMSEDFDFAVRAVKSGVVFKIVREPLVGYLLHNGSKTAKRKLLQNRVALAISERSELGGADDFQKSMLSRISLKNYLDAFIDIQIRKFLISARPSKLKRNYLRLILPLLLNPKRIISKFLRQRN